MNLFTKAQFKQLLANGRNRDQDHFPVVKLFTPDANCSWLITEIDPEDPDMGFGCCDLGLGYPELGYISIPEIRSVRGKLGLPIERDIWFTAEYPLSVYLEAARRSEAITEDTRALNQAVAALAAKGRA
jgi:hypothetical protein